MFVKQNHAVSDTAPAVLRPVSRADLSRIATWHRDPALFATLVGPYRDVSEDEAVRWMERHWFNAAGQQRMAICRREDGVHIGNVSLNNVDRHYRHAAFGIFIGSPGDRGRGYGRTATLLMLQHAFEVEGLHRVYLDVLVTNTPAVALYRSCGFCDEGISREAALKDERWVDLLRMSILEQDYVSRR